jgi:hypothetical protein
VVPIAIRINFADRNSEVDSKVAYEKKNKNIVQVVIKLEVNRLQSSSPIPLLTTVHPALSG